RADADLLAGAHRAHAAADAASPDAERVRAPARPGADGRAVPGDIAARDMGDAPRPPRGRDGRLARGDARAARAARREAVPPLGYPLPATSVGAAPPRHAGRSGGGAKARITASQRHDPGETMRENLAVFSHRSALRSCSLSRC